MSGRILVGTRKGTVMVEKNNGLYRPRLAGHPGQGVNFVAKDPNSGTLWACLGHGHWGAKLSRSTDDGATWADAPQITYPEGARYIAPQMVAEGGEPPPPKYKDAVMVKLWYMNFDSNGRIYAATIPGGLFHSDDGGESFQLNLPLWNHESRGGNLFEGDGTGLTHWFGTPAAEGEDFAPGLHSVTIDPRDPNHVYVAISCAGVLETTDGGKSWRGRNKGMSTEFLPTGDPEWGYDPHYIELCAAQPDNIWMQNHCGVYYSSDAGENWKLVSDKDQGIHFGFPIVADQKDGKCAWVIPGKADMQRMAIDGGIFVGRTSDGGESWDVLREGLPQENAFDVIYRHAFGGDGDTLCFGTTTGNLYVSEDRGDSWQTVANNLPPVYSVRFG